MERIVFLNTSILTNYGVFEYIPATIGEVREKLESAMCAGNKIISAIGHESTAEILTTILRGMHTVRMNRIQYRQEDGDTAIVFKLRGRSEEGKILNMEEIEEIGYDLGFLKKVDYKFQLEKLGVNPNHWPE